MRPSRGLCRRLTAVGGTSIEGERNRSACRQPRPSGLDFSAGRHQPTLRAQNAPAALLESWARDRAPLRQGDMPSDWQLNGTGVRLCIR
jgi:hypothetical protein